MEKEMKMINWEEDFFVNHRTVSAVKGVEFVNDRMSYIILTGRWVILLFGMCIHQVRKKVTIRKKAL